MKRALVTGATGMVGSYIVERLLKSGWMVRALVREPLSARWLEELGVELAPGRLGAPGAVTSAASSCDAIFHSAAMIAAGGDWAAFYAGNVEGTGNVVKAAQTAGARLVHVSSTAVYGENRYSRSPADEECPLPILPDRDVYGRSKQDAERVVTSAAKRGLETVIVRPPMIYGIRDRQFVPRLGPVMNRGVFPLIGGGRNTLPLVHASAIADGAVRAAEADAAVGQIYLLANDFDLTVADLVRYAAIGLERHIFAPRLPIAVGRAGFRILEGALVLAGRSDVADHGTGTFRTLTRPNPFTSERARRELGWSPEVGPALGIPEAFRWWAARRAHRPLAALKRG